MTPDLVPEVTVSYSVESTDKLSLLSQLIWRTLWCRSQRV